MNNNTKPETEPGAEYGTEKLTSRIHPSVHYTPSRVVYPEDCDTELTVYEQTAFVRTFLMALGKPKYLFAERGVYFVPIYLVPTDPQAPKIQIGVYEYEKDRAVDLLDQDGDMDIDRMAPLFYPFAPEVIKATPSNTSEFLAVPATTGSIAVEAEREAETEAEATSSDSDDDDNVLHLAKTKTGPTTLGRQQAKLEAQLKKGVFTVDPHTPTPALLPEESQADAEKIRQEFEGGRSGRPWLQEFMKNPYYDIHPVEANGDCLFATIRDAFKQIGHHTTVADLRAVLAREVTDDVFQENRRLYLDLLGSIREYDHRLEQLKQGTVALRKQRYKSMSSADREANDTEKERIKKEAQEVVAMKKSTQEVIDETMGDLSAITTFDQYREYIQSSRYWADSWAISTLERVLNIKLVIFSELYYNEEAPHSVLNCGEVNRAIEQQGRFHPNYYIMTTYSGNHYNLVSYKTKKVLTFSEIPYDVKTMIINKCIEKSSGIYYLIEDFRNFKVRLGIAPDMGAPDEESDDEIETEIDIAGVEGESEGLGPESEPAERRPRMGSIDKHDLYDSTVVFRFFAKSEKTPLPGKGTGETIPKDKMAEYKDLKGVVDWRRKLDDSWVVGTATEAGGSGSGFMVEGHPYASVEHYYQSAKFRYPGASPQNQDFARLFALDSDSKIAQDVGLARAAGGKSGKLRAKAEAGSPGEEAEGTRRGGPKKDLVLRPKEVTMDPHFYEGRHRRERAVALQAKFEQLPEMRRALLLTKRAKLVQYIAKQPPVVDVQLMEVRRRLKDTLPVATIG